MRKNYSNNTVAWFLLLLLALMWGSSFILVKRGLLFLSPVEISLLRISSASLILLPFCAIHIKKIPKDKFKYLIFSGLLSSVLPSFLFAFAQTQLKSSITGVLNALTPIFTLLIGFIFYNQRIDSAKFIGILLGFVGTTILITGDGDVVFSFNHYVLLTILAALFYAINSNMVKHYLLGISPLAITSVSITLVGVPLIFILFLGLDFGSRLVNEEGVLYSSGFIILLGVMNTAIAYIIFNHIIKIQTAVFASTTTYFIPIVAIFWGIIDGETLTNYEYVAISIIFLGVYLTNRRKNIKV